MQKFVDGVDLGSFCRVLAENGERTPMAGVGYIIGEVFEALHHAHTRTVDGKPRAVIHRDVTPSNVLISSAGEVGRPERFRGRFSWSWSEPTT